MILLLVADFLTDCLMDFPKIVLRIFALTFPFHHFRSAFLTLRIPSNRYRMDLFKSLSKESLEHFAYWQIFQIHNFFLLCFLEYKVHIIWHSSSVEKCFALKDTSGNQCGILCTGGIFGVKRHLHTDKHAVLHQRIRLR